MTLLSLSFKGSKSVIVLWSLAGALLLFDAGFYLISLKPREKQLTDLEREYQSKREASKPAKENKDSLDEKLNTVYDQIPAWGEFTRVMGEIYDKAGRLNLLINSVSYRSDPVKGSKLVKVTVSMPVTGSYGDIKRFIYDLETSPRLFIIQDLSLGAERTEEGDVSLSLTIVVHFKG